MLRQVALEVHDTRCSSHSKADLGNLQRCVRLLEAQGFQVVCAQQDDMRGTNLYMLYATRAGDV